MFAPSWRQQALAALDQPFDLVVLGGGINGSGIFFDAAQRGLRALLVERDDLASGTSSRSSKLVHGGLRYLKRMQLGLTRASVRERDLQIALQPHLVTPLPWVYPAYRGDRPPGWQVELGLWLYDHMTRSPDKHRRIDPDELAALTPGVPHDGLDRALVYHDARVDDARLVWSVAATGAAYGGHLLTRCEPEEAVRDSAGRMCGVVLRDLMHRDRTHRVQASLVVNATGTWVDRVRHRFGFDGRTVRPSRGSHLLFSAERLPINAALAIPHPDDQRPVFFIPHPEGVLVGTTDLFHDGELDDPRATDDEVGYLLRATAAAFPDPPPTLGDVRGVFAGLRPVLDHGAADPSAASREEAIWTEQGLMSVAGGKLTTWRLTAEEAVDAILEQLPPERARKATACATAGTPLAGLAPRDLDRRLLAAYGHQGLEPNVAAGMARRLGSLSWHTCPTADAHDLRPIAPDLDLCPAEIRCHLRHGAVSHLADLLLRRVRLGMWRPARAREVAEDVLRLAAAERGWNTRRCDAELRRVHDELRGWSPDAYSDTASPMDQPSKASDAE